MNAARERATPEWAASAPALVLVNEEVVTATDRGRLETRRRFAVRVLTADGARAASCAVPYVRGTSEVRELRAWLIDPGGTVREWNRSDALDASLTPRHALYGDLRTMILAPESAPVGSVYAWESREESRPLLAEWRWRFRTSWPTLRSSFSIALPAGLEPEATMFGTGEVRAVHGPGGWTWSLEDQPAWNREPLAPARWSLEPTLAVSVRSPGESALGAHFRDWGEVSRWLHGLSGEQAEVDAEIQSRAAQLVTAADDAIARMASLASAVQRLNYVHVQLGLGQGWGYRPNSASEVLRLGYGDCKDKANLLRAFMSAAGYRSWLVVVNAEARDAVEPDWPSPTQFDHCILAIQAPDTLRLAASVEHPTLGRLVFFDPTDALTPFGSLPAQEQGGLALLQDADGARLIELPVAPPEEDRLRRRIEAALDSTGALEGSLHESSWGSHATSKRALRRHRSDAEYRRAIARWLGSAGGIPEIRECVTREDSAAGSFDLRVTFGLPRHGRLVQGRMLVVRADVLPADVALPPPDSSRSQPVSLPLSNVEDEVSLRIPAGFRVDELPDSVRVQTDFGALSASWRVEQDVLRFERRLTVRPVTLEPARYGEVQRFLAADAETRRAQVVLVRR